MEYDYFVRYKPRSINKWQQRHNNQANKGSKTSFKTRLRK